MDSLVLKCYSTMLNRPVYRFHLNRQFDCDPVLMFELKPADNDRIDVNELIDSNANTIPVKVSRRTKKTEKVNLVISEKLNDSNQIVAEQGNF